MRVYKKVDKIVLVEGKGRGSKAARYGVMLFRMDSALEKPAQGSAGRPQRQVFSFVHF